MRSPGIPRPGRWRRSSVRSPAACSTVSGAIVAYGVAAALMVGAGLLVFTFPSPRSGPRPTSRRCRRCSPASLISGARRSCSARSRSTSLRCSSAARVGAAAGLRPRHPRTRPVGARAAALGAGHRRHLSSRCGSPATRSRTTPARSCSVRRPVRRLHGRVRPFAPSPGCRSSRWLWLGAPTWSASTSGRR